MDTWLFNLVRFSSGASPEGLSLSAAMGRRIEAYSRAALANGLLSLEDALPHEEDPELRRAISLVVDGVDPEMIKENLALALANRADKADDALRLLVIFYGVLALQAAFPARLIWARLAALFPEGYYPEAEGGNAAQDAMERVESLLALLPLGPIAEGEDEDLGCLAWMADADIQKFLREIDSQDLAIALAACPRAIAEAVLRNMSKRATGVLVEDIYGAARAGTDDRADAFRRLRGALTALDEAGEIRLSR